MPLGSNHKPTFDPGPSGLVERIIFPLFGIIGGVIGAAGAAAAGVVTLLRNEALREEEPTPLSPAEAALAVVKGWADETDAAAEARLSGVDGGRFSLLTKLTGNPPGPGELVDQWRRGLIDDGTLAKGLRESYLRPEWFSFFRNLRHVPLTAREYLQGAVEGHIDLDAAKAKVDGLGMSAVDAQLVYDTLGNPPGVREMLRLWKRGKITRDEAVQVIRESHYKNKYTDAILELADYYPPPRTITTLLSHGAITTDQADRYFQAAGLSPELAQAYVASALHSRTASHKELSTATIRKLYADRMLSRAEAVGYLEKVGYSEADSNVTLDLADVEARNKVRQQVADRVRTNFVARRIDAQTAVEDLARIGIESAQATELVDLWAIEQTTPTKSLTVGQLNAAVKKLGMPHDEFVARVIGIGYSADDAEILWQIDVPPTTIQQ